MTPEIVHHSSTLPQEVIEMIIDHLYNDHKALANCSLVAHSWVIASHYHLFHQIQLGRADIQQGSNFLQLLDRSSSIRQSTRIVLLWGASISVCPHALVSLLDAFPNLHSLRMYGITCKYSPARSPVQWTRPRTLRRLELSGFEALQGEIVNTLAFFSRVPVDELLLCDWEVLPISLHQPLYDLVPADAMEEHLHGWQVAALSFMDNVSPVALDIARKAVSPEHLRSLDASERTAWTMPLSFSALLTDVGPQLEHLRLDVTGMYTHSTQDLGRAMACCTSLRSLHLYIGPDVFYDRFASVTDATAAFPDRILQYAPPGLETITLAFGVDYDGEFLRYWVAIVNWEQLEERLMSFVSLRSVRLTMEIPYPGIFKESRMESMASSQRDVILASLPRLREAGKVAV